MGKKEILCIKCEHYYSTWDPVNPRGCKLYGFITKQIPKDVIKKETGTDCEGYQIKEKKALKSSKLDLNDDSLW